MEVIPAIDIRGGACVRLLRGDPSQVTIYSQDPVAMARHWAERGAQRLHVVDLDGAFGGQPLHLEIAARMKSETGLLIEFGGGLRTEESVRKAFSLGIDKAVLGTAAVSAPAWVRRALEENRERLIIGLDCREDRVAIKGWAEATALEVGEALALAEEMGFRETIFTDIGRDGALEGPNADRVRKVARATAMKVIASGGVTTLEDLKRLREIPDLEGVIIGKALYEGALKLEDCLREG